MYRQHHQGQVTRDNPTKTNPEISKIVGQLWAKETPEIKKAWKDLADKEAVRHKKQHPEYQYKPRRVGKDSANKTEPGKGTSPTDEGDECPRCHGRISMTPQTPATPIAPVSSRPEFDRPGASRDGRPELDRRHSIDHTPLARPPFADKFPPVQSFDDREPLSPEMKRRRANDAGLYHPVPVTGGYNAYGRPLATGEPVRGHPGPGAYGPPRQYVGPPLPEPGTPRPLGGPMPPPPPPRLMTPGWPDQGPPIDGRRGLDELRLPPLQTAMAPRTPLADARYTHTPSSTSSGGTQEQLQRGFQNQIMALPFKRKLELLSRVCQPTPPLNALLSGGRVDERGAFVAVEGTDQVMLEAVGRVVERALASSSDIALQVWSGEAAEQGEPLASERGEAVISEPRTEQDKAAQAERFSRAGLFRTILEWQDRSKDIEKHITTRQQVSPTERTGEGEEERSRGKVPVALVPDGYSLTVSDKYSSNTDFADAYGPVDHWQWMASMWRGTVCPDLIVYVKPAGEQEIDRVGTVEVSRAMGMLIIRGLWRNHVDEATERRIMFEINEWVREGSFRDQKPANWRRD